MCPDCEAVYTSGPASFWGEIELIIKVDDYRTKNVPVSKTRPAHKPIGGRKREGSSLHSHLVERLRRPCHDERANEPFLRQKTTPGCCCPSLLLFLSLTIQLVLTTSLRLVRPLFFQAVALIACPPQPSGSIPPRHPPAPCNFVVLFHPPTAPDATPSARQVAIAVALPFTNDTVARALSALAESSSATGATVIAASALRAIPLAFVSSESQLPPAGHTAHSALRQKAGPRCLVTSRPDLTPGFGTGKPIFPL